MFGKSMAYDVYHLSIYLAAIVSWAMLCLTMLFAAHRLAPRLALLGRILLPICAVVVCLGILMLDIWAFYGHEVVEYGLLVVGVLLPAALLVMLYKHVHVS